MPEQAIVADVGRTALRIGVTDGSCSLVSDSVRTLSAEDEPTVSGAVSGLAKQYGMVGGRIPLAVAVSGMPRGDMISVTNGRWRISRPGLAAMLQREPLILNDFAANAWPSATGATGSLNLCAPARWIRSGPAPTASLASAVASASRCCRVMRQVA